jgi:formylglycine-generating enzyme
MKKLILILLGLFIFQSQVASQKMELVAVEGGTFFMGNDYSVNQDEAPEHKVTLNSFYIGKYEVTFEEFDRFCSATGWEKPDDAKLGRDKNPVMNISWEAAVMFCNWLSRTEGFDRVYTIKRDTNSTTVTCDWNANGYRLPTEAEWEYAAKGGNQSKGYAFSGSNNPEEVAWYFANSGGRPQPVGLKKPNELGIFDMTGNVREWCWDIYDKDYYKKSPENNPTGPTTGLRRVYRGGAWNFKIDFLRITSREFMGPSKNYGNVGFRVVRKK